MSEVREYGKYVFYRNEDRVYGYASAYTRRCKNKASDNVVTIDTTDVREAA
jgi:hypothetical protein